MHPDLRVDALELAVERLGQELEIGVGTIRTRRAPVVRRLLDLDQRTARGGQLAELGVHDVREIVDQRLVVLVVLVPQHAGEGGRADRAELQRPVGQPLRHLPERRVLERTPGQLRRDHAWLIGLLYFPEDAARPQAVALHPAARGVAVAVDSAEPLDRVEEPRLAAYGQIEPRVAVGHDVEPGGLLRVDDARDRVQVLLAKDRVAERRFEQPPVQALGEPERPGIGPGDGGRQHQILGDSQHRSLRAAPGAAIDKEELIDYMRASLAPHKTPKHWFVVEAFPLTGSGKIQKYKLREAWTKGEMTAM